MSDENEDRFTESEAAARYQIARVVVTTATMLGYPYLPAVNAALADWEDGEDDAEITSLCEHIADFMQGRLDSVPWYFDSGNRTDKPSVNAGAAKNPA